MSAGSGFTPLTAAYALGQPMRYRLRKGPYALALVLAHHRIAEQVNARNLAKIRAIHAASLPDVDTVIIKAAPDKQKTPDHAESRAFTNRNSGTGSHGGCSTKCA